MEIFGFIWKNSTVVAAVLTGMLGTLGIKNILGRIGAVVGLSGKLVLLVKELNDIVIAVADAIKPDPDGKVRVSSSELDRIKKELSEVAGVLKELGK